MSKIRQTSTSNSPQKIFFKNNNENNKSDRDISINMLAFFLNGGKAMDLSEAVVRWCSIKRAFSGLQLY